MTSSLGGVLSPEQVSALRGCNSLLGGTWMLFSVLCPTMFQYILSAEWFAQISPHLTMLTAGVLPCVGLGAMLLHKRIGA